MDLMIVGIRRLTQMESKCIRFHLTSPLLVSLLHLITAVGFWDQSGFFHLCFAVPSPVLPRELRRFLARHGRPVFQWFSPLFIQGLLEPG